MAHLKFTDRVFIEAHTNSCSLKEIYDNLGLKGSGSDIQLVRRYCQRLNLNYDKLLPEHLRKNYTDEQVIKVYNESNTIYDMATGLNIAAADVHRTIKRLCFKLGLNYNKLLKNPHNSNKYGRLNKYTDDELLDIIRKVKSVSKFLKSIGLKASGSNYRTAKKKLQELQADTSHWTGTAWNKGEKLKDWSSYKDNTRLSVHLIKDRGHKCEDCGRKKWKKNPIKLEVHHIDGNRTNNEYDNLQLLCPNCHADTDNWRGRKNKINATELYDNIGDL